MAQVEDLVKTLEQHHEDQRDQALAQTAQAASAQRSDLERRMYADAMNVETRVFRLRFADVGPTTRNFHGRTITIPGVLDTLNAMLGNEGTAPPPYTTQTQTGALFRPSLPARSLPARAARRAWPRRRPDAGRRARLSHAAWARQAEHLHRPADELGHRARQPGGHRRRRGCAPAASTSR